VRCGLGGRRLRLPGHDDHDCGTDDDDCGTDDDDCGAHDHYCSTHDHYDRSIHDDNDGTHDYDCGLHHDDCSTHDDDHDDGVAERRVPRGGGGDSRLGPSADSIGYEPPEGVLPGALRSWTARHDAPTVRACE